MNIKEAREALALTLTDIAGGAIEKGLTAQTKCFIADHDLNELSDDNIGSAVLIAGEILVGTEGSEEKLLLECAVCVNDGEVTSEDMLREVNTLRESMKELCEKLDEKGNAEEAFAAVVPESISTGMPKKVCDPTAKISFTGTVCSATVAPLLTATTRA